MHALFLNQEEAAALEKLIRAQILLYREAEEGASVELAEPFTGEDLDRIEPLLSSLAKRTGG